MLWRGEGKEKGKKKKNTANYNSSWIETKPPQQKHMWGLKSECGSYGAKEKWGWVCALFIQNKYSLFFVF